jgi:hypothetical protein
VEETEAVPNAIPLVDVPTFAAAAVVIVLLFITAQEVEASFTVIVDVCVVVDDNVVVDGV